jgi:hypothetical protein
VGRTEESGLSLAVPTGRRLAGVLTDIECDREANAEGVDDHPYDHYFQRKWTLCSGRELDDDAVHEKVDGDAVQDSGKDDMIKLPLKHSNEPFRKFLV